MTDGPTRFWSAYGGNLAGYDFINKKMRPHWQIGKNDKRETILLQNHQKVNVFNLVCASCGFGWTDGIPVDMRLSQVECPYCKYSGSVVRS